MSLATRRPDRTCSCSCASSVTGARPPGGADESRSAAPASPGSTAPAGTASLRERRVAELVGIEVIGSGGDKVGEVDDIVLSTAGVDSVRAVLQVGGVAGIGEKRISLPLNQLTVERAVDDEPTLRVALDTEALERWSLRSAL